MTSSDSSLTLRKPIHLDWVQATGGRWFAIAPGGRIYVVRPTTTGDRLEVARGRISIMPATLKTVDTMDDALAAIITDFHEVSL